MQIVFKIISDEIFCTQKKSDFKEIIISSKPKTGGNSVGDTVQSISSYSCRGNYSFLEL